MFGRIYISGAHTFARPESEACKLGIAGGMTTHDELIAGFLQLRLFQGDVALHLVDLQKWQPERY
jgi:hypothetical protein